MCAYIRVIDIRRDKKLKNPPTCYLFTYDKHPQNFIIDLKSMRIPSGNFCMQKNVVNACVCT